MYHFCVIILIFMKIKRLTTLQVVFYITAQLLQDKRQGVNGPHSIENRNVLKFYPGGTGIAIQAQYIPNTYLTSISSNKLMHMLNFSCMNSNFEDNDLFIFTNTAHR